MAKLIYVIGASGAGKDSLLQYVRQQLPNDTAAIFAHRYITREADAVGENHIALSVAEFEQRRQLNCFAMSWYSHKTYYGIGIEVDSWLAMGITVVINGSRAYLNQAMNHYPELLPVLVEVDESCLRQRLINRGRENKQEIEHRLEQARQLNQEMADISSLVRINNNSSIAQAGNALLELVLKSCKK